MTDNDLLFIEDDTSANKVSNKTKVKPWKLLIVDDNKEVHTVTKLVLTDFTWDDRPLEFLSAYSGKEAEEIFSQHDDIAVALIDVVMETDDAGLLLIKTIRNIFNNKSTRLVLRTGQPGQAPERKIIREYEISDYKNKTELSGIKLDTLICSMLRAYKNIIDLQKSKASLKLVVESASAIFESKNYETLITKAIYFLKKLIEQCTNTNFDDLSTIGIYCAKDKFELIESQGVFDSLKEVDCIESLPEAASLLISQSIAEQSNIFTSKDFVLNIQSSSKSTVIFYVCGNKKLSYQDISILDLFSSNIKISFDNEELRNELEEGQREIVYLLGEAVESKSKETGNHIRRVAEITYILAVEMGFSLIDSEKIKSASPLHDLGKIGIPDEILNKPGRLTPDERKIMESHVEIGYDLVKNSTRDILKYAATISLEHHEKWDGTGYPSKLQGDDISLVGRIAALADVFDALAHERCYKKAWPMDKVIEFIYEQKGKHFDPKVVDAFEKNQDKIIAVNLRYKDSFS